MDGIPNVVRARAEQARAFHREIEQAVKAHRKDPHYLENGYRLLPFVGTRQPTFQSAELLDGRLIASTQLPSGIDELLSDGDSTVPRLSAIPIELSEEYHDTFVPEKHGAIHSNRAVLNDVRGRLEQMQVRGLKAIRGPEISREAAELPAISLDLDDLYFPGEPVALRVRLINAPSGVNPPVARIEPASSGAAVVAEPFRKDGDNWVLIVEGLNPGIYRVEVNAPNSAGPSPPPVHDLFELAS